MKTITNIAGLLGVISRYDDPDMILYWLRESARRIGFQWTGVGARNDDDEFLLQHDYFPAGCYEKYIEVFGDNNPIRVGALASGLPFVWHAEEIRRQSDGVFDPHHYGVEWGISTAHHLDNGSRAIVNYGASLAPGSENQIWHLSSAIMMLSAVSVYALEQAGYFGGNELTEYELELLSYLATPEGKNRKRAADHFEITVLKLSRIISSICKRLNVETETQAFLKVAPALNSKKWERK